MQKEFKEMSQSPRIINRNYNKHIAEITIENYQNIKNLSEK